MSFTESVRHLYTQMLTLEKDLDKQLRLEVQEINSLAQQIADLNALIGKAAAQGTAPNDLLDRRDLLLEELARLTTITVHPQAAGQINVNIGGISLVSGVNVRKLTFSEPEGVPAQVKWEGLDQDVNWQGGAVAGIIRARDQIIPSYRARLDDFAATFIAEFNAIHAAGYGLDNQTGIAFFQGTGAQNWSVNPAILDDNNDGLSLIAAASEPDKAGDGSNAALLAGLKEKVLTFSSGMGTVDNFLLPHLQFRCESKTHSGWCKPIPAGGTPQHLAGEHQRRILGRGDDQSHPLSARLQRSSQGSDSNRRDARHHHQQAGTCGKIISTASWVFERHVSSLM